MECLQKALDTRPKMPRGKRAIGICSPEDEINDLIKTLHYGIQHGRNNLAAEKKLLRDIKQAEAERDKITVDVSTKPNIWGYWELKNPAGSKEAMKDRIKLVSNDLDILEMEKQAFNANLKRHKEGLELKTAESDVARLQRELKNINRKKDEVYKYIVELKRQTDEVSLRKCLREALSHTIRWFEPMPKKNLVTWSEFNGIFVWAEWVQQRKYSHLQTWNKWNMFKADVIVGSLFVDFYAKYDRLEDAHHCYDKINEKKNALMLSFSDIKAIQLRFCYIGR
ncbi:hypothetical protein LguiA_035158 [Lonicera macranthoides]